MCFANMRDRHVTPVQGLVSTSRLESSKPTETPCLESDGFTLRVTVIVKAARDMVELTKSNESTKWRHSRDPTPQSRLSSELSFSTGSGFRQPGAAQASRTKDIATGSEITTGSSSEPAIAATLSSGPAKSASNTESP